MFIETNIVRRIDAGERLVLVQKYDPDKLDYYRTALDGSSFIIGTADGTLANIEALGLEGKISALE
jgi:hypothetical protein